MAKPKAGTNAKAKAKTKAKADTKTGTESAAGAKTGAKTNAKAMTRTRPAKKSSFMCLLVDEGMIYLFWEMEQAEWEQMQSDAVLNAQKEPSLFVEVYSLEGNSRKKLDDIPVFGQQNRWRIFIDERFVGQRLVLSLSYEKKEGGREVIAFSSEIDVPLRSAIVVTRLSGEKKRKLYEISDSEAGGGSEKSFSS